MVLHKWHNRGTRLSINGCGAAVVPVLPQKILISTTARERHPSHLPIAVYRLQYRRRHGAQWQPLRGIVLSTFQIVAPMPSLAPAQYLGVQDGLPNHYASVSQFMGRPDWPVVRLFQAPSQVVLYHASQIDHRKVYPIPWHVAILPSGRKCCAPCRQVAGAAYRKLPLGISSRLTVHGRMVHCELPNWA